MFKTFLLILLGVGHLSGQTAGYLGSIPTRSRPGYVDFRNTSYTRPMKTGTSLPATCTIGDQFFKSDATAGENLYGCTAANTWTQQAGGGGGGGTPTNVFTVSRTSGTVLAYGSNCAALLPCQVAFGNTVYNITSSASITLSGASAGSGTFRLYVSSGGVLTAGHNITDGEVTCTGCTKVAAVTAFPYDSIPLYTWTVTDSTGTTFDTAGGSNLQALLNRGPVPAAGTGISIVNSGGISTISLTAFNFYSEITTSQTWTKPSGVEWVFVKVWGGGGGGAGANSVGGGGGSGGGYAEKVCRVTGDVTVTIGAAGTGGAATANGTDGGQSSFGTCAVASGGGRGKSNTTPTPAYYSGAPGVDADKVALSGYVNVSWGSPYPLMLVGAATVATITPTNNMGHTINDHSGGWGAAARVDFGFAGIDGFGAYGGGGGGGSGAYGNSAFAGGTGGTSKLSGAGGNGGAATSGAGTACAAGSAPGGGGGGGARSNSTDNIGCDGAAGKVQIFY